MAAAAFFPAPMARITVAAILAKCYEQAKKILNRNKDKLEALTQALLDQETLNRAEFVALMETGSVPEGLDEDKPRTTAEILEQEKPADVKDTAETEQRKDSEGQDI